MQLVAYGAQDIYLTGNPQITFFKVVYRRHTNFAMESIEQTFNGAVGFGNKVTALVSRNGDLVNGVVLEVVLPNLETTTTDARWTDDVGHHLVSQVDVEIGGQLIDRHYSDWLEIWAQLTVSASQKRGYREMIGMDRAADMDTSANGLQSLTDASGTDNKLQNGSVLNADGRRVIWVPLQFWFCRNVGLSLPLIALQYHEVKITVTFNSLSNLATNATMVTGESLSASLWVDYIYLDTDERRRFAQVSHEYLIEQLQFTGNENYVNGGGNKSIPLNYNHPVKELVWVCREDINTEAQQLSNYTNVAATVDQWYTRPGDIVAEGTKQDRGDFAENPVQTAKLQLNGHDRFNTRVGGYFNLVQTRVHTSIPDSPGVNVYSFALKPEDHQPSGTCNFSRIDNAKLVLMINTKVSGGVIKVFATNYNVLRIMSGMGGLAYSN